jgi:hypothetical protein
MMTRTLASLERATLAQLLFVGPVQPSEQPSPAVIRLAIAAQYRRCRPRLAECLAAVAQEAGDHPDSYAQRMRWALRAVDRAYACARKPVTSACSERTMRSQAASVPAA